MLHFGCQLNTYWTASSPPTCLSWFLGKEWDEAWKLEMVQLNVKGEDILPYSCERRRILGNLFAFELSWQVGRQFGRNVSTAFAIITATQFHLLFYLSRPLPNVFALALGKWTFSHFCENRNLFSFWVGFWSGECKWWHCCSFVIT
jgi:hypothetical protein